MSAAVLVPRHGTHAIVLIEAGTQTIVFFSLDALAESWRSMGGQIPVDPSRRQCTDGDNQFNMGCGWTLLHKALRHVRDSLSLHTGFTTKAFAEIAKAHDITRASSEGDLSLAYHD